MSVGVVIAAAGQGKRMRKGMNKQYMELGDRPMIVHTLEIFERMAEIDDVVVVTGEKDVTKCQDLCRSYGLHKVTRIVPGGKTRQESVRLGLEELQTDWVLVHDGARPFVSEGAVRVLLARVAEHGAAILGVPVKETVKKVNPDGVIEETPDRQSMWVVQTPQAFRLSELKKAHKAALGDEFEATDDAMLMEHIGIDVHIVHGDYRNIKITTPEDVWFAEAILKYMRQ